MINPRLFLVCVALLVASCGGGGGIAADGGVSGTGAAITGNVTEVAGAGGSVAGIRVEVQGTDVVTVTDADGFFVVEGEFDGPVTLVFSRADDGLVASVDVQVPGGGTVQLDDLMLDGGTGQARPTRRAIQFRGRVESADCAAALLFVVSRFETRRLVFTIHLDRMVVRGSLGRPVRCEDLVQGTAVEVTGVVLADETIADGTLEVVQVDPTPTPTRVPPTATPTRQPPEPTPTRTREAVQPTRERPTSTPTQTRERPTPTATPTRQPAPSPIVAEPLSPRRGP